MELMCVSVSVCVCVAVAPGNGVPGQTVIGRPSDRVTEHIKHTHTQTFVCLLAQQQPHRNIPVGANQMPPLATRPKRSHTGTERERQEQRQRAGGEVGTQESKKSKGGEMRIEIGSEG